ncbi:hypothetical protein CRM22_002777 [Opisthorchis felineus]|uniref:C2 domain-containing protein n=1 Tax=Opisthorchis felineus TaxID=147828 RepID=A0A4S2MAG8_OPIFE|nr:hypothetical protein CRM22_002777 [Opisthorchis felineus]
MLSIPGAVPKIVSVRVQKAERLRIVPKADGKQRKYTQKWKVVFLGGKKKMSSGSILAPAGNPVWDYEVTFKVAARGEPISLLVTDSEDHHVGQVVIPVTAMPPRPANSSERPTDPSRLRVSDLEPTKKVENPIGTLYYWVWVEEYRPEDDDKKSTRGSLLSLASHRHSHKAASVADSLNYRGSVLSVASTNIDDKVKKSKHLFKKKHGAKDLLKSAADVSQRPSLAVRGVHDSSSHLRARSIFDPTAVTDDHDGSVLGACSDLTGSDLLRPSSLLHRVGSGAGTSIDGRAGQSIPSSLSGNPLKIDYAPSASRNSMVNDSVSQPALISIEPNSCSTEGGVEVTITCSHVTEDIVRYATLLIDGYSVQRQDWFHQDSKSGIPDQSDIRVYMPSRPPGRCYIELETMKHGRIRCPQEFVYTEPTIAPVSDLHSGDNRPTHSAPKSNPPTRTGSELGSTSPFQRTGSQRSSLLVRDGRSLRRKQMGNLANNQKSALPNELTAAELIKREANHYNNDYATSRSKTETHPVDLDTSVANTSSVASATSVATGLFRRGSQRSSVIMLDRRSTRRRQLDPASGSDGQPTGSVEASPSEIPNPSVSPFQRTGSRRTAPIMLDRRSTRRSKNPPALSEITNLATEVPPVTSSKCEDNPASSDTVQSTNYGELHDKELILMESHNSLKFPAPIGARVETDRSLPLDYSGDDSPPNNFDDVRSDTPEPDLFRGGSQHGSLLILDRRSTRRRQLNPVQENTGIEQTYSETTDKPESRVLSPPSSPFRRSGSQRSGPVTIDRRSTRREQNRPEADEEPVKTGAFSKEILSNAEVLGMPVLQPKADHPKAPSIQYFTNSSILKTEDDTGTRQPHSLPSYGNDFSGTISSSDLCKTPMNGRMCAPKPATPILTPFSMIESRSTFNTSSPVLPELSEEKFLYVPVSLINPNTTEASIPLLKADELGTLPVGIQASLPSPGERLRKSHSPPSVEACVPDDSTSTYFADFAETRSADLVSTLDRAKPPDADVSLNVANAVEATAPLFKPDELNSHPVSYQESLHRPPSPSATETFTVRIEQADPLISLGELKYPLPITETLTAHIADSPTTDIPLFARTEREDSVVPLDELTCPPEAAKSSRIDYNTPRPVPSKSPAVTRSMSSRASELMSNSTYSTDSDGDSVRLHPPLTDSEQSDDGEHSGDASEKSGRSIDEIEEEDDVSKTPVIHRSSGGTKQQAVTYQPSADEHDPTPKEEHSPVAPSFLDSGIERTGSERSDFVTPEAYHQPTSASTALREKALPQTPPESSSEDDFPAQPEKSTELQRRSSLRSAASGQSRSALDDNYRLENEGLRAMLDDANARIDMMTKHTIELEGLLSSRSAEVDRLSLELCKLRNRLLQDGCTKYLEMHT